MINFLFRIPIFNAFLGLPTWYEYLPMNNSVSPPQPQIQSLSDIWLIVAAVIDILLRIASVVAVVMIIYAGIQYITSEGEPEKTKKAQSTAINALIGLLIAVGASVLITFIAGRFHGS